MAPPAYTSFFGPEGWENLGFAYSSFFGPEGWESPTSYTSFSGPEGWETVMAFTSFWGPETWEIPPNYSSVFGPEGWESLGGITYITLFGPESWEKPFPDGLDHVSIDVSPAPSLTGETVTVSGRVTKGRLRPEARANTTVTIEIYDANENLIRSIETTTDANGDYSEGVLLRDSDAAYIRATTTNSGAIAPFGGPAVEGWES